MGKARGFGIVVATLLAGCGGGAGEGTVCDDLCDTLVRECNYEAYPTLESCLQGCAWEADNGGDMSAQSTCVADASCDTFEIIECEHKYGAEE